MVNLIIATIAFRMAQEDMTGYKKKRVASPKKVVKTMRKVLSESEMKKFIENIPIENKISILSSENIDMEFGKYILGDRLLEYMSSDYVKQKEISQHAIIDKIKEIGITIDHINLEFRKPKKSKLIVIQSIIDRAKNVIDRPHTLTDEFLVELKNILLEQKAKLEKTRV